SRITTSTCRCRTVTRWTTAGRAPPRPSATRARSAASSTTWSRPRRLSAGTTASRWPSPTACSCAGAMPPACCASRPATASLALKEVTPEDTPVVFVSKDISLRIKAAIAGSASEDYENDRALDDFSLLSTGATELPEDFWRRHSADLRSWSERGRTSYEVEMAENEDWYPNQFLYLPGEDEVELRVAKVEGSHAVLEIVDDFRPGQP